MNDDDESQPSTAQTLANLSSSLSALAGSSRAIPSDQDFHFFSNFDRFRHPLRRIAAASESSLDSIAASPLLSAPPFPADHDDAYDRLVDANDAILDRLDSALDSLREDDGFTLVVPKNKNKKKMKMDSESDVKMADKKTAAGPRPKVPFHIPTIPRPQTQYSFNVVNHNQPFVHAWLDRSEDGLRLIHPLEKISVSDFVDNDVASIKPVKPPPLESTPFKLVEEVQDLKELAAKLRGVNEFAVDLEHNQYRSFQGLTCLIQISTRTEDFVIDAFKLRVLIGPHLREVFKDPTKRKVMHGAERDIIWLQRDFGIYVCNLFDTGQASRELKLERNSLEYLLHHFCGVTANKEYQNADWRLRPVPEEMLRYAREDTHYLLHIYDLMRIELVSKSKDSENPYASLLEVYKRSYDICMQLYEKELLTEDSYLYLYGLQDAGLNAEQLAVVAGLYEWRDVVAREKDESTGYILPNKALLEIAKTMPDTIGKLRRLVKSRHLYVEQHLGSVFSIIINSKLNAAAFEAAVEHLREGRVGRVSEEILAANDEPEVDNIVIPSTEKESAILSTSHSGGSSAQPGESGNVSVLELRKDSSTGASSHSAQVTGVTVQVQKKPSRAFGALLGNTIPKKKLDSGKQDKLEAKLEQIRSSVHFPLHSFSSPPEQPKAVVETPVAAVEVPKIAKQPALAPPADSKLDDVIMLEDDFDKDKSRNGDLGAAAEVDGDEDEDEPMSLSDLSSSFQQCFEAANQKKKAVQADKSPAGLELKLFDYEAARKQVVFGDKSNGDKSERTPRDSKVKKNQERAKSKDDGEEEFSQGRRRKAFPATGNRSATFR